MSTTHSKRLALPFSQTTLVIIAGALILSAAMGIRQTFGLFIGPFSFDRGLPVTLIAFAIALHNLVWGFAQPFAGAAADRYGSAPVVAFGATIFAAGLGVAAVAPSGPMLIVGMGLLVGIGVSLHDVRRGIAGDWPRRIPGKTQYGDGSRQRRRLGRTGADDPTRAEHSTQARASPHPSSCWPSSCC